MRPCQWEKRGAADARGAAAAAGRVAMLIGPELEWDSDRVGREAAAYADRIRAALERAGIEGAAASAVASDGRGPVSR